MKTKKLLFTLIAAMTMLLGATLTAHAEEAPAPSPLQVIGSDQLGYAIVPSDWTLSTRNYGIEYIAPNGFDSVLLMAAPYGGTFKELRDNQWKFAESNGLTITDYNEYSARAVANGWVTPEFSSWHGQDTIWFTGTAADGSTYNCYKFLTPDGIAHSIFSFGPVGDQFLTTYRFNGK